MRPAGFDCTQPAWVEDGAGGLSEAAFCAAKSKAAGEFWVCDRLASITLSQPG